MTERTQIILTAILLVLAFANLALGHWTVGFSLIAVAVATGRLTARRRNGDRR